VQILLICGAYFLFFATDLKNLKDLKSVKIISTCDIYINLRICGYLNAKSAKVKIFANPVNLWHLFFIFCHRFKELEGFKIFENNYNL